MKKEIDESQYLDPVFLKHGMKVYTYEYVQKLRKEILDKKRNGKKAYNLIPQAGFQERVLQTDVDIKIIGGKRGAGKALSVDSQIITPFGIKRMGDIVIGDIVTDPTTGLGETVTAIYEHPQKDLYELMFDDGTSVECCLDHLWKVRKVNTRRYDDAGNRDFERECKVMTFAEIKQWLDEQNEGKHLRQGHKDRLQIPLSKPTIFDINNDIEIDPYVIGAILGDGCITNDAHEDTTARFCTNDPQIEEEFVKAGIDMSRRYHSKYSIVINYGIRDCRLERELTIANLYGTNSKTKFIPDRYKHSSVEQRFSLVQGLLDTDGCISKNGVITFCSVSQKLAEDLAWVIRSLGGYAKIYTSRSSYRKDSKQIITGVKYEVYIKFAEPQKLFRLERKRNLASQKTSLRNSIIKKIEGYRYVGKKDARCITVDGMSSLYMTNDFIVTHNTFILLYEFLPYIFIPDVNGYIMRKYEDDISRGPWKASKQVYRGFGLPADSYFSWTFLSGKGATMKMEHLQDPKKISDRFRGVEMAYIGIDELAEHTRDSMATLFDLLASNRSTAGVKPKCVCTCNPVGKSNKLRQFLDWYIDPETDTIIPEKDGKVRYFYRFGEDVAEIAWGDTWEEVYNNPSVKSKIDRLCEDTGSVPKDFVTSLAFIEGGYQDNVILQVSDPKYMNRIAARGGESTTNDIVGVWRDIDSGSALLTMDDVNAFYANAECRDGVMRASADVALSGDFFVIYAFDGHHICDMAAWTGVLSDDVVPMIEQFLNKNGVRKENFTYDSNGLGMWLKTDSRFQRSIPFNNKSAPSDSRMWNNLKSESCEKFIHAMKHKDFSIDQSLLHRKYTDLKGHSFTFAERFMTERLAFKRKDNVARFEIIEKTQMKLEIGHSPDFAEGLMMVMPLFEQHAKPIRKGFSIW